jgi:hypothetical protein
VWAKLNPAILLLSNIISGLHLSHWGSIHSSLSCQHGANVFGSKSPRSITTGLIILTEIQSDVASIRDV